MVPKKKDKKSKKKIKRTKIEKLDYNKIAKGLKKSPLDVEIKEFTREELDEIWFGKKVKQLEPKGICVICKSEVVPKKTYSESIPGLIGHANKITSSIHHYYCTHCGIQYEFLPLKVNVQDDVDPQGFVDHEPEDLYNSYYESYDTVTDDE